MSDKEIITASVESWVAEELDKHPDVDNKSALINRLLKDWLRSGQDSEIAAYKHQLRQIRKEKKEIENRMNDLERKEQRYESMVEKAQRQETAALQDRIDDLDLIPADPTHPEIQQLADKHDKDPEEVAQLLADTHNKDIRGYQ